MTTKAPISRRALLQRVNRELIHRGQKLCAARSERARKALGDFFVVDVSRDLIDATRIDPERLGRELGVLAEYERVEG